MTGFVLFAAGAFAAAAAVWAFSLLGHLKTARAALRRADEASEHLRGELKQAEESQRRAFAILESISEGVVVVDADQKVLLMNSSLSRSLDLPRERIEGRFFWEVFRDADLNRMLEGALARRLPLQREHALPFSESVFEIRISPVFGGEEFLGVAAVFYEVTRLKQLERARSEFVANVSHELKTPLTSIMGFVETLKEGAIDDAENRMRFLGIIEEHAQKLHRLIEDLLYLSRIESKDQEMATETVDFERVMERMQPLFERALRAKDVRLRWTAAPVPFLFHADPKAIEQVFTNLIDNAIKYNEPGGEVGVSAREESGSTRFDVSDTGIGIPESDLLRVFERFYRVEKSRSRELGGTGLGLSIVKHLIERHGGRITASSDGRSGTTFTFWLPKVASAARPSTATAE